MNFAPGSPARFDTLRPTLRRRAASFVMAMAATFLIIFAMLTLNGTTARPPLFKGGPVTLDLNPDVEAADVTRKQKASTPRPEARQTAPPPRPIPPQPPVRLPTVNPYYIPLTREENDAADIYKLPQGASTGAGTQAASSPGDSRPIGTAPDGEPLYAAQWYRRPTHAELNFYLPAQVRSQEWGMVACRTIAAYHVDDCVELGSSPGTHLAGAVRQAAWQFLVRPPRLGGRELVGTWVSIRIILEPKEEKPGDAAQSGDRSSDTEP